MEEEEKGEVGLGLHRLFRFADGADAALMAAGAAGAVASGVAQPLMTLVFGEVVDAFGSGSRHDVLHRVSVVCLKFFYLAIGSWVACFLQVACWMITGERQAARIRGLYLEAVLRQDIAFFDKEITTGQLVERMSGDTILIQDAIGEKVASFNGENRAIALYNKCIRNAYISAVQEGTATGLGFGFVMFILFCSYGLTAWFGAKLIIDKGYGGGQVVSVWMAFMTGAMSLGEATPCVTDFASGQAAGYRMMQIIQRKPEIDPNGTDGIVLANLKGTHTELLRNPNGAYSQLIQLQDITGEPDASDVDYQRSTSAVRSVTSISESIHSASLKRSISVGASFGSTSMPMITTASMIVPESTHAKLLSKVSGEGEVYRKVPLSRLISLNKPEIPVLLLGTMAAVVSGVIFPMLGVLISSSIKSFYEPPHQLRKDSRFWTLMYVASGVASFIFLPVEYFLFGVAGGKLVERIRSLSFESIVHQEISWFDKPLNASGTIGARLSVDASNIRRLVGDSLALMVRSTVTVLAGFIIAMVANWRLALVATIVLPLGGLQGFLQIKFLEGFSADAKAMYEEATQVANDAVSGIRTVASFCAEPKVMKTYYGKCKGPVRQGIRQGIVSGLGFGISFFVLYCTYALCFYVGAKFMLDGKATFTEVFRVFFALLMATIGVSQTSALGSDSAKAKESASSIFALIDRKSKIDPNSDNGTILVDVAGELELHHVCFSYPSRLEMQIFRDLNLRIPSGKTVALVGESGCGKSTIIALMERFYDPDSGMITLDGVDIKSLKVSWLRGQMGLVSQEPVLFNDTIRANIAYGKQGDATEEEIIAAAKAANAHQFISALPQGYGTFAGERGAQLSGGQKQRVAIARAVLRDPRILLLDEATSALDTESERAVQEALDRAAAGRTTIVVAHRLSTIRGADIIAVLRDGVVVAQGTHKELMASRDGVYASLVELRRRSERAVLSPSA
ncbi:ABC transporter B family member 11 [Dichanthelium oligosanthes]|uniref:ABC transporter B family member 11 n=1 Tax=Dichanthelium oligosanthes TaxID=888268 RepID=A0A1E5WLE9_9POAL|nr:ABC transporter B family member 11 [Dichanthelium oligosanthes]